MKIKKYIAVFSLLLAVAVFLLSGCAKNNIDVDALIKEAEEKGLEAVVGRTLITDDGSIIFYRKEKIPVLLYDYDYMHTLPEKLSTGDKALFIYEPDYNYAGITAAQLVDCIFLEDGSIENITDEMLEPLKKNGWVDKIVAEKEGNKLDTSVWQEVYYKEGIGSIRFKLPENWTYEIITDSDYHKSIFMIEFKPENESGTLGINYHERFGICETGLESFYYSAGDYMVQASVYDDGSKYDYINIRKAPGDYEIVNSNCKWYDDYKEEIEGIFSTLKLGEDLMSYDEALKIAYEFFKKNYSETYTYKDGGFRQKDEFWQITFGYFPSEDSRRTHVTIKVTLDGKAELFE